MATKYGVFSEPGVLKPGADYAKEEKKDVKAAKSAAAGEKAGFKSGQALRSGKLNDATFSQFTSTNVCAPYEDGQRSHPSAADKAGTSKPAKGAAGKVETPFKPSSPMKKSSAPQAGDLYGTLSKPEHVLATPQPHLKKGDVKSQPRGIYTTVPKSGGYGTNKFTLSERKGVKGVAGEYEYMADPMQEAQPHVKGKEDKGSPFKPSHNANKEFGHYEYLSAPAGGENAAPKKAAEKGKGESAAFKPANVFGRKLETVPYMANPLPEHKPAVKGAKEEKAWHPSSWDKTDATRSIVRMNL